MIWKPRVPPDSGVQTLGEVLAFLVGSRFTSRAVDVRQLRVRIEQVGAFVLARVIVNACGFLRRAAGFAAFSVENIRDIVVRLIELGLTEVRQQVFIAAMAV